MCLWDMKIEKCCSLQYHTRYQKTILRSTDWRRPTLDEVWTWVDKIWQMMGPAAVMVGWVQVPLSPAALVPNCHAFYLQTSLLLQGTVFERQTCMLCAKLTPEFPALNSLWIVLVDANLVKGIHQVFATPNTNRMLCLRETALPIQFLDHHACRF